MVVVVRTMISGNAASGTNTINTGCTSLAIQQETYVTCEQRRSERAPEHHKQSTATCKSEQDQSHGTQEQTTAATATVLRRHTQGPQTLTATLGHTSQSNATAHTPQGRICTPSTFRTSTQQTLSLPLGRKETLERSGDHTRPTPRKSRGIIEKSWAKNGYGVWWLWWWWCGRDVMTMSLSIPPHERAPNWGDRTPGSQTPGVPAALGLNVQMDGGRKMLQNCSKLPLIAATMLAKQGPPCTAALTVRTRLCCATGSVLKRRDELYLRHFHCARDPNLSLRDHSDVQDRKKASAYLQDLSCATTGMSPTCPRSATVKNHSFLHVWTGKLHDLHNRDIDHFVQQQGNLFGPTNSLDHKKRPLHLDREIDDANSVTDA